MERAVVVVQEERFKMRQRVLLTEQPPDAVFVIRATIVKLDGLHVGKLGYQLFVDDEVLLAILSW